MRRFIGGDFSNIEGRVNAWLAGEAWKLEAFQAYDLGYGPDLYRVTSAGITGKELRFVTKLERQTTGKVPELACGFQGGVGAFITMGQTQTPPLRPEDMVEPVRNATPPEVWEAMRERYATAFDRRGLKQDEWTAIKLVVTGWRTKNPKIVEGWWELQDAAIQAVQYQDQPIPVYSGRANYMCSDGWLYCQLPSGRLLHYANPWIKTTREVRVKWNNHWIAVEDVPIPEGQFLPYTEDDIPLLEMMGLEVYERTKHTVHFMGLDSETKQWVPKALYGGLQCENIVQGTAADLLRCAMKRVEAAGYPIVLHAHDEILSEVEGAFGSVQEYGALMAQQEPWAEGLPVSVSAWEDTRYVK